MRTLALALLFGLATATPHVTVSTSASATAAKPGTTVSLFVDVTPDPKIHVYAPGAKDYLPVALELSTPAGVTAAPLQYPKSQTMIVEPLKERVPVYDTLFRLVAPVKVAASVNRGRTIAIDGVLKYQACDDAVCYKPVSAPVRWTLQVK